MREREGQRSRARREPSVEMILAIVRRYPEVARATEAETLAAFRARVTDVWEEPGRLLGKVVPAIDGESAGASGGHREPEDATRRPGPSAPRTVSSEDRPMSARRRRRPRRGAEDRTRPRPVALPRETDGLPSRRTASSPGRKGTGSSSGAAGRRVAFAAPASCRRPCAQRRVARRDGRTARRRGRAADGDHRKGAPAAPSIRRPHFTGQRRALAPA